MNFLELCLGKLLFLPFQFCILFATSIPIQEFNWNFKNILNSILHGTQPCKTRISLMLISIFTSDAVEGQRTDVIGQISTHAVMFTK